MRHGKTIPSVRSGLSLTHHRRATRRNDAVQLQRRLGLFGAVVVGLGSILGTGVFVSIGLAAGIAGPSVVGAIVAAAVVAVCNALSSAQLAAAYPVSGGTYEYGYQLGMPRLGFAAGWLFLLAKTASAATAALGFAGYGLHLVGAADGSVRVVLGLIAVAALVALVLGGVRRTNVGNAAIVCVTVGALVFFVIAGLPTAVRSAGEHFTPLVAGDGGRGAAARFLEATALMFVAYTGYGRIATLGEEVREPKRTIPRAIIVTLVVSAVLYVAVGFVGVGAVGAEVLGRSVKEEGAPLEVAARSFGVAGSGAVLAAGAVTAMLGVLLNLILGLSRVLLAMGRRGDMPRVFSGLNAAGTTPSAAVLAVGAAVACVVAVGSIKLAWSFSAFTVLVYYAATNFLAARLPAEERLYPRWIAWSGLVGCLGLAFFVELRVWIAGVVVIAVGLGARAVFGWVKRRRKGPRN